MNQINFEDIKTYTKDHYVANKKQLDKLYGLYDERKITTKQLINYALPALTKITGHYTSRLYSEFRIDCSNESFKNGNITLHLYECQYWGFDNVLDVFKKCLDTYDYSKSKLTQADYKLIADGKATQYELETKFANHFSTHLNYAFSNVLWNLRKTKYTKKTKGQEQQIIKINFTNIGEDNMNELNKYENMIHNDEYFLNGDIECEQIIRDFTNNINDQTDRQLFSYMMQKYYTGRTYCLKDIAMFAKLEQHTAKYKMKKINKNFQEYLKGKVI